MDEIIPADKKYRRRMLGFLVFGLAAGAGAAACWVPGIIGAMGQSQTRETVFLHIVLASLMVLFLILIPFGLYILGLGKLTIAARRFPPPGVKVIRDTRLLVGDKAVNRGRTMIITSIMAFTLSLWGILSVYRLAGAP